MVALPISKRQLVTGKRVPASRVDRSTSVHISGFFAVVVVVVIVTSIKQLKKKNRD